MKRLYLFVCMQTLATWAIAEPHRQSLPERLGDGPIFLLAWICAGAGLFFVGAVAYTLFRKKYWPTAIQKAHLAWLLATKAVADTKNSTRPTDAEQNLCWSRQALAALTTEDRFAVEQVLRLTKDHCSPKELQLFYKTRESLAWMWGFVLLMVPVLWAGYELVWMGQTGTSLWWAYLVICGAFSLVLGALPIFIFWNEMSMRRKVTPAWQVNAVGIGVGNNMNLWPQIEEIHLLEKAPQVLVALKRFGDTETKYFPNIDPANVKLCFADVPPDVGGNKSIPLKEIMLPEDARERAATLAAILRYRQHWAQAAFAEQWQAYRAADT